MIKAALMWILKAVLGGIVGSWENKAREAAERKAAANKVYAQSVEEGKSLEIEMIRENQQVEKTFKVKAENRGDDDPFGIAAYNEG